MPDVVVSDNFDEKEQEYRYQSASRIRNKIEDELTEDIEILQENQPQLLAELRDGVCEDDEQGATVE